MASADGDSGQVLADIRYHLIWATRRRRPFLEGAILERTVELLAESAEAIGVSVVRVASGRDYLIVTVEALPELAPTMIVARLKRHSASALRREFRTLQALPSIWTRQARVTTREAYPDVRIRSFVERQPRNERRRMQRIDVQPAAPRDSSEIEVVLIAHHDPDEFTEVHLVIEDP